MLVLFILAMVLSENSEFARKGREAELFLRSDFKAIEIMGNKDIKKAMSAGIPVVPVPREIKLMKD